MQIFLFAVPTGVPESFKGKSVNGTSIALQWKEIFSYQRNGVITGYKVLYKLMNSTVTPIILSVAGNKLTVIVQNLRVNISYEFKIAGETKIGIGPYGKTITVKVIEPGNLLKGKLLQAG